MGPEAHHHLGFPTGCFSHLLSARGSVRKPWDFWVQQRVLEQGQDLLKGEGHWSRRVWGTVIVEWVRIVSKNPTGKNPRKTEAKIE